MILENALIVINLKALFYHGTVKFAVILLVTRSETPYHRTMFVCIFALSVMFNCISLLSLFCSFTLLCFRLFLRFKSIYLTS